MCIWITYACVHEFSHLLIHSLRNWEYFMSTQFSDSFPLVYCSNTLNTPNREVSIWFPKIFENTKEWNKKLVQKPLTWLDVYKSLLLNPETLIWSLWLIGQKHKTGSCTFSYDLYMCVLGQVPPLIQPEKSV